jgi:hypothetical protein
VLGGKRKRGFFDRMDGIWGKFTEGRAKKKREFNHERTRKKRKMRLG